MHTLFLIVHELMVKHFWKHIYYPDINIWDFKDFKMYANLLSFLLWLEKDISKDIEKLCRASVIFHLFSEPPNIFKLLTVFYISRAILKLGKKSLPFSKWTMLREIMSILSCQKGSYCLSTIQNKNIWMFPEGIFSHV